MEWEMAKNLAVGQRVKYGFTLGEIVCADRKYGQDGYKVRDITGSGDYGSMGGAARWVPEYAVTPVEK
jgi:hypothetical protein